MASSSRSGISRNPSGTRSQISTKSSRGPVAQKSSVTTSKGVGPPKVFQLPALSVPYVPKKTESEIEKLKKRTIRRNAPPGEDLKGIKAILRTTKAQNISVQEFISLIAPSTGDNGAALREVMLEDLNAFRKLARKVYETITQDNSDVLLNQQLQLVEYYKEKKSLFNAKMMRIIEEIYSIASTFDFDRYAKDKEKYLEELLPIPQELKVEPEEVEMMKRQAAYHRLQWLHSEGERLNEENNSLKKRLNQMKRLHMEEQAKMAEMERMAEAKKDVLEAAEAEKEDTLEKLNDSLEKSIIAQEKNIRLGQDSSLNQPRSAQISGMKKKKSKTGMKKFRRPKWNEEAAAEIENRFMEKRHQNEVATSSKERSPFHFSPIKSPEKSRSPAHYSQLSPPTPRRLLRSSQGPFFDDGEFTQGAAIAAPTIAFQQESQQPVFRGRRSQAPRDSWSGFY